MIDLKLRAAGALGNFNWYLDRRGRPVAKSPYSYKTHASALRAGERFLKNLTERRDE
jgi:hypothetical protein